MTGGDDMKEMRAKILTVGIACGAVCAAALAVPPPPGGGGKPGPGPRPAPHHSAPAHHHKAPKAHNPPHHKGPKPHVKAPPPHMRHPGAHVVPHRPPNHRPCGRLHPHGYHIGPRHIQIFPPIIVVEDYYWTEEVLIDGVYYILYCYPDGTKRFSDGTIFCYF